MTFDDIITELNILSLSYQTAKKDKEAGVIINAIRYLKKRRDMERIFDWGRNETPENRILREHEIVAQMPTYPQNRE